MTAVLRSEWVKFRTVRGWVIGMLVAGLAIIGLGLGPSAQGSCGASGPSACTQTLGPGGEAVTDSFYLAGRTLDGNGAITARVTSLTGQIPDFSDTGDPDGPPKTQSGLVPWAKAGIIIKASLAPGSAYAAMMVTGDHGVRMQWDYTGDVAAPGSVASGSAASVSDTSPRWLRLVRAGSSVTGYDSADGRHWTKVATVTLAGLPTTVRGGLFATSPPYTQLSAGQLDLNSANSSATGTFDQVSVAGGWHGNGWAGTAVGAQGGPAAGPAGNVTAAGGRITVTGTGDIAPSVAGAAGIGVTIAQTLIGLFAGLIAVAVIGAMFMTAEYRRGLIRVTLAATPRRWQVLAAKAVVLAAVAFAVGLVSSAVVVTMGQRVLREHGVYVWPASGLTEARVIVGSAAMLAVAAVIALAIGALARRGAAAVAFVIVVIVLPYLLTVTTPLLPPGTTNWLARVTPAAAIAVQQTLVQYPQVANVYAPASGYYPLPPWAGFAVLCAWAAAALALAAYLLNRRDA